VRVEEGNVILDGSVEWACLERGGRHSPIEGIDPGPFFRKQEFLEGWAVWTEKNRSIAEEWLLSTAEKYLHDADLRSKIEAAVSRISHSKRLEAWEEVAAKLGFTLKEPTSTAALNAVPVRLAIHVQRKERFKGSAAFKWTGTRPNNVKLPDPETYRIVEG